MSDPTQVEKQAMYLSLLIPNMHNTQARRDMRQPYDLHRTLITRVFGANNAAARGSGAESDVLFRIEVEPAPTVLVQSRTRADWSALEALCDANAQPYLGRGVQSKEVELNLHAGQKLAFRLSASPTRRAGNSYAGHPSIRIGDRIALLEEEEQLRWLSRKFEGDGARAGGFRVLQAVASREERVVQKIHDGADRLSFLRVQFDGVVEVMNAAAALQMVQAGVGTAKGNGCGLLSLAPAR